MTATNHVITGALIGLTVHNPFIALPAAFLSHFILDALPHYGNNNHTGRLFIGVLLSDSAVAGSYLLMLLILQPQYWLLAITCGIAAASPDLMWLSGWIREMRGLALKKRGPIRLFHKNIQWAENSKNFPIEIIWFIGATALLVKLI